MKVKKLLLAASMLVAVNSFGQGYTGQDYTVSPNVITTAVPFVSIAPDARGGSMGDCGVASDPDVYSMHYNPAKYVYLQDKLSFGLGYSPWLRNLVNDMNLAYLAGAYKINDRSAVAGSLRYFSCGEIDFRDVNNNDIGKYSPNEWAIDATYSRLLGDYLSGAVAGRFIYSNLTQGQNDYASPAISVAADIGVFYKRPVEWFSSMDADFAWGASITNIGSKVSYNKSSERKDFIPTMLRLGSSLKLELDEYNSLAFNVDFSKLLVPTPPVIARDSMNRPIIDPNTGEYQILYGLDNNVSTVAGMIQSFYDAPGHGYNTNTGEMVDYGKFYEELCEINFGVGVEYWYNNVFAVRTGYFNESALKGNRKYVTLGAALKYNVFGLDVSYLIPVNTVAGSNPLENTLRFNLTYSMGGKKG
ncbi:MAG: type IX secretion system outer membrane channel protein PorV [Bacteroidales bacterium]|nr:type IX secretion system outer membrane channel protein PorV [Bacteroidales bacterium]